MITPGEEEFIREHAYLPEHIISYGTAVSRLEPFLTDGYLYFFQDGGNLVFIGYPLNQPPDSTKMEETLQGLIASRNPGQVAILAPSIPAAYGPPAGKDYYYSLDVESLRPPPKVTNMIRRASGVVKITRERTVGPEHLGLIRAFYEFRKIDQDTRAIFQRIPAYLETSGTAAVFSARTQDGNLIAFDIADFWANHYAFYMFNFRSPLHPFPGASDLLLQEIITEAKSQGKTRFNLGLGINAGVAFFKTKWGARPFLPHESVLYRRKPPSFLESLFQGMRRE
jgi:hypothetical protein